MLKEPKTIVIAGCGEIGAPLYQLSCGGYEQVIALDPRLGEPEKPLYQVAALQIAIPGGLSDFISICKKYIETYRPEIVLIHSSSYPGVTDRLIGMFHEDLIVHTQVHGKHHGDHMRSDMLRYPKFVATKSDHAFQSARKVLVQMGHPPEKIIRLSSPLAGELVKLLATSFFGYLIAWAQSVERLSDESGVPFQELMSFTALQAEDFKIENKFPGVIGGHCVIPNLEILIKTYPAPVWDFILDSNAHKIKRDNHA